MAKRPESSCNPKAPGRRPGRSKNASLMRHRGDFSWTGVKTERYKHPDGTWADVARRVLVGSRGEKTRFHLRYFEIAPGGYTSLEHHRHEHVVIGLRGRGRCTVGRRSYEMGFLDTLHIGPDAPHQLENPFDEPFGFFCLVNAKRDKPKPLKGR